ncbi:MAG: RRXRR domain-containing protein [Treponema sp.]|nr:RRXRR domain-containing protein [Treponema sp.]MBR7080974.1 RRXRR domain-containing protein [Treponema sp.]
MLVYVLDKYGNPLMPCSARKARQLLKQKKAVVKKKEPFTIQFHLYKKALCLFVNWAEENGIGYDNIPSDKYFDEIDDKGLGYIEGMMYIALKEAKNEHSELYEKWIANVDKAI